MAGKGKRLDSDMTQGSHLASTVRVCRAHGAGADLFQQLYNTVDTIVVGQFVGKEALAAVGSDGQRGQHARRPVPQGFPPAQASSSPSATAAHDHMPACIDAVHTTDLR